MKPRRTLAVVGAVLALLVAVYGLKVWHAQGICDELHGQWEQDGWVGECRFLERDGQRPPVYR